MSRSLRRAGELCADDGRIQAPQEIEWVVENGLCPGLFELAVSDTAAPYADEGYADAGCGLSVPHRVADEDGVLGGYTTAFQRHFDDVRVRLGCVDVFG